MRGEILPPEGFRSRIRFPLSKVLPKYRWLAIRVGRLGDSLLSHHLFVFKMNLDALTQWGSSAHRTPIETPQEWR